MLKLIFYLLFIFFLPFIFGDLLYDTVIKNPLRPGCFHPLCQINVVRATTTQGAVFGYSIWFYEYKWINYFLGVPYADRPLAGQGNRFKPPQPPRWFDSGWWDATKFQKACPQARPLNIWIPQEVPQNDTDEDCLYMNIALPNETMNQNQPWLANYFYPILVMFVGEQHAWGDARMWPPAVLVQYNMMIVTVNYRLNALGFLSLENAAAPGNYGLLDQVAALNYIQSEARSYRGDPSNVTLLGHGSGACDVGLHLLSELSGRRPPVPLFNQAILMDGSDLMDDCFHEVPGKARAYALELAYRTGCSYSDDQRILRCLREDRTWHEISGAAAEVSYRLGQRGVPWAGVVDGTFIKDLPRYLRGNGSFSTKIRLLGGLTYDAGGIYVTDVPGVKETNGVSAENFRQKLSQAMVPLFPQDIDRTLDSLTFEYTYWPDIRNTSWRLQMLRDLYSDWKFGSGLDATLKYHASNPPGNNMTTMYVFRYRSPHDPKTNYMGAYHFSDLQYLLGFPYFNDSMFKQCNVAKPVVGNYSDLDRNASEYMMLFWSNFVRYGNATPIQYRNQTWNMFKADNLSYLLIDISYWDMNKWDVRQYWRYYLDLWYYGLRDLDNRVNYRQYYFSYWRNFFPVLLQKEPVFSTIPPTPANYKYYQGSTFGLAALLLVLIFVVIALLIVLCVRSQRARVT